MVSNSKKLDKRVSPNKIEKQITLMANVATYVKKLKRLATQNPTE